jgi:signal transduction histidine kinase
MLSLKTQLSLAIVFVVLLTVALISFLSNTLINRQFEAYIIKQQQTRTETIAENVSQYYNGLTNEWDLTAIHALSMYSLYDGYIIKVHDNKGAGVWDTESHNMAQCRRIMEEISARMAAHGASGDFESLSYDLTQNGQKTGVLSVKYYGPFFLSESDFSFLSSLNLILLTIGVLSLLFSFVTGRMLAKRIARPIRKTADIALQIASGHYDVQFESRTKTRELHGLASAVNHLANALAKQERLRKQLTADVAHDLRTPLTTLSSHLEAFIEQVWEPTPERLKSCHEEILRLSKIVEDLERLERVESGNLKLDKTSVDLLALSKIVCDNFAAQLAMNHLRLAVEGVSVRVPADKDRINGVIANLISNAVKYTPEGGHIRVVIRDAPESGICQIEDTGPGVPQWELPYIFERFYRADKSRNRNTGGAGIGLAIVKSVVTAHGGTVTAENRAEGGCRFTVKLPKHTA